jgi:predicted nuclease of restriction endonuclease-like (RecB) superfamily
VSDAGLPAGELSGGELAYGEWLEQIKRRVSDAQRRAAHAVNAELIGVYWEIGREILGRQASKGDRRGRGGPKVIERLSADLAAAFPGMKGVGLTNLRYMRTLAVAWPERLMLQRGVGALPRDHITVLLDKLEDREARDWYASRAASAGWTRKVLEHHIVTDLRSREGAVISNFADTLVPEDAGSVELLLRDPTVIDFIDPEGICDERSLEQALVADIERFMLALGQGFLYAGRQRSLMVGGDEFRLDLLFYHHPSRRWVVIELKAGSFEPEFVGKVNFYVNAIDQLIAGPEDRPTVGFILCTDRNETAAHMTLSGISTPLAVGRYVLGERGTTSSAESIDVSPGLADELGALIDVERQVGEFAARRARELAAADRFEDDD